MLNLKYLKKTNPLELFKGYTDIQFLEWLNTDIDYMTGQDKAMIILAVIDELYEYPELKRFEDIAWNELRKINPLDEQVP